MRASPSPLVARITGASALVAAVVGTAVVVLVVIVSSLRDAATRERHSRDVTAATLRFRQLAIDTETGLRGYIITGDERFLQPLNHARRELPTARARLERLVADDPGQQTRTRKVAALINAYLHDYVDNVIKVIGPVEAQNPDSTSEGKRRTDNIRRLFVDLLAAEDVNAAKRSGSVDRKARLAVWVGAGTLIASVALILLFGAYLARAIARPIRSVALAAGGFAANDFAPRLPEDGPGEVGELERAFNAMARALEQGRSELVDQNRRLQESERHKSELISMVSHEVRTPLSSILGFTQLLLSRDFDPEMRRRYLEIVDGEARRLASLAEDFLDVQLLEEGHLELAQAHLDLDGLLREQVGLFLGHSDKHRSELDVEDGPLAVVGDRDRIAQVIGNLLSNAIKYSPEGGVVEVTASRRNDHIRVTVRDEGIGIGAADREQIFTKFFRGAAAATGIPGTGIGLAVARQIVERHGGEIGFESTPGRGSTFWLELPAAEAAGERRLRAS